MSLDTSSPFETSLAATDGLRVATDDPPEIIRGIPRLSVIVPLSDGGADRAELLAALDAALAGIDAEVLLVGRHPTGRPGPALPPSRLAARLVPTDRDDLAAAFAAGTRAAAGDWVLLLAGEARNRPRTAAAICRTALRQDVDLVIGTRYAGAQPPPADAGPTLAGSLATRVAKTCFPRRLATVTDPMSSLFVVRRAALDPDLLRQNGIRLLLEILVRHPGLRVAEVAYPTDGVRPRRRIQLREGLAFGRLLAGLRRTVLARQLAERPASARERGLQALRAAAFGMVGLTGIVVNSAVLWVLYQRVGLHQALAASVATQASTTWNFLLVDGLVYRRAKRGSAIGRALRFYLMNNLLLLGRLPVFLALMALGLGVLTANGITLVLLFGVRFLLSDRVIYGSQRAGTAGGRDPVRQLVDLTVPPLTALLPTQTAQDRTGRVKRSGYLSYRYDVAGVVRIGSAIELPELEFFRAQWVSDDEVDIAVRVGDVGRAGPRRRAAMTEFGSAAGQPSGPTVLHYEEHLGRLGANFRIMLGEPITIEVGPLLARSPHVVYTNVIEALLRFVMVSRGRMLLHSACVELDGVGVMLSALTDTGKTATVLRLLREHGGSFLSDDMTIVDPAGTALCFPKPLTISAHTLRAVQARDLTRGEWRRLRLQSRLHSKGGRSLALTLARFNVPIMGINALTQMLVPPPKYTVDRLVPTRLASTTQVRELFIIERGTPRLAGLDPIELDPAETLERMLVNTDDAYGFPPFRYLASAISVGGLGYTELRAREREILAGFLRNVRTRVLASDTFGWAESIATLVGAEASTQQPVLGLAERQWPRWEALAGVGGPAGGGTR